MKNLILSLLGLLIINCTFAQNGGQFAENDCIKIEQIGFSGGQAIIKVTNNQNCLVTERVTGATVRNISIAANSSDTIHITPKPNTLKISAKPEDHCSCSDSGPVEITVLTSLPLKFTSFNIERINDTDCYVIFEVAEVLNVRSIDIKVSIDGKIYKVFASLKPNQTYYKERLNLGTCVKTGLTPLEPKQ